MVASVEHTLAAPLLLLSDMLVPDLSVHLGCYMGDVHGLQTTMVPPIGGTPYGVRLGKGTARWPSCNPAIEPVPDGCTGAECCHVGSTLG